ncbi:TniQ family protein [Rhizobium helianthi]|uniref:TniQ family protein n=1 Tax=Rhizobium helianthi TaxID=1132695 RepID=A0ABW4M0B7_9HYPH
MVLPVTLEYHADETAIDFVARLAAANGFSSLRSFLGHTDVTARAIEQGDADALALVTEWSGVSVSRLQTLAVVASGAGETWRMGHATLSKEMRLGRRHRLCARCVMEDRERRSGRHVSRAYRRAWWSVRGIEGCHLHDCALLEVSVGSEDDVHDFPRFVEANLAQIEAAGAAPLPSRQPMLDRYLRDRVFLGAGTSFLDALHVHVAAEFSRYLGDVLALHQVREWMSEDTDLREWGFCLAMKGENEIRRAIAQVIDRDRPMAKYVGQVLGPMAHWLRRNLSKDAYQPIVDLMQDILVRNMPFGEGQTILKPVEVRYLHSVTSAHAEYGLTHNRIRALLKANDPDFRDGFSDACTYFDAAVLRPILLAARETVNSREAGDLLGVSEEMVHGLLSVGILTQVERRADGERAFARIEMRAVDALIQSLANRSAVAVCTNGFTSLASAASVFRQPFKQLVGMVLDGSVEAFIEHGDRPIFERVYLASPTPSSEEARKEQRKGSPFAGGDGDLMRLKEAELALGTTTITVAELIRRGYLTVKTVRRDTGRVVKFIERTSLEDFKVTHASLSEIAKSRQGYRAAIKAELDSAGVAPIFEPEGFIARFYRRTDLTRSR